MTEMHDNPFIFKGVDLRVLARRQRILLWFVLTVYLPVYLFTIVATPILRISNAAILSVAADVLKVGMFALIIGVFLLMRASSTRLIALACGSLLLLIPYIRMLILYSENVYVSDFLREAGLEVGLMGVRDENIVLKFGKGLCHNCGYNLAGNVTEICPECGMAIIDRPS
jgi:hypothetical protein